jgi:hypothetical protein
MEKEFVPYELALQMKQLGFDEPCLATYEFGKIQINEFKNDLSYELCLKTDVFPAPTFSQAFRWFRKKYGLSGNIDCCDKLCEWNIKSSKLDKSIFSSQIQSYEEAELECLKKLIEIVHK